MDRDLSLSESDRLRSAVHFCYPTQTLPSSKGRHCTDVEVGLGQTAGFREEGPLLGGRLL